MKTKEVQVILQFTLDVAEQISQHIQADETAQSLTLTKSLIDILSFILDKPNSIDSIKQMA